MGDLIVDIKINVGEFVTSASIIDHFNIKVKEKLNNILGEDHNYWYDIRTLDIFTSRDANEIKTCYTVTFGVDKIEDYKLLEERIKIGL